MLREIADSALEQVSHGACAPDLLSGVMARTRRHIGATSQAARQAIAQVFTPPAVARFMAARVGMIKSDFHFVDAGAGVGVLAAALCERIAQLGTSRRVRVQLFETDPCVTALLRETMDECQRVLEACGHQLSYSIHAEDFVSRRRALSLFGASAPLDLIDAVIMNPPYFKLAKDSPQARAFVDIVHGQPNIYSLFMAAAVEWLRPGGDLVAITPRSFCNGLYFREFRRWLLERMSLRQVHLFESRRAAFRDAEVLQESIITVATRAVTQSPTVLVSASWGADLTDIEAQAHAAGRVVDRSAGDYVIRLPTSSSDLGVMRVVESWPASFAARRFRISTGPVVSFRATKFLLASTDHPEAVPLLSMHNIRPFATVWPLTKGRKPVAFRACEEAASLLLPAQNYVIVRRFSAKEEVRRLTASVFLPSQDERLKPLAIENHLNYVTHRDRELSESEAHGLAALFNSALLDRYFRILSGNTQVNATEIRSMPFPELSTISRIGSRLAALGVQSHAVADAIVFDELGIDGAVLRESSETAA